MAKSNVISLCDFASKRYTKRLKRGQDDLHAWAVVQYDYNYRASLEPILDLTEAVKEKPSKKATGK